MIDYNSAKTFIETQLVQSKYPFAGQPVKILPWAETWMRPIFDTPGRYKLITCFVPRKQAKSIYAACVAMVYLMSHPGQEIYILCATYAQSEHMFHQIRDFIEQNPALDEALWVREHKLQIEYEGGRSLIKVLSTTHTKRSSMNCSLAIMDEVMEHTPSAAQEIFDKLRSGIIARPNGLLLCLSSANYNLQHFAYHQLFIRGQAVIENPDLDRTWLPVHYSLPNDADVSDEKNWLKVNPACPTIVPLETYRELFHATRDNPRALQAFKTFHLNMFCGSSDLWIDPRKWSQAKSDKTLADFKGDSVIVGLDLSSSGDLTAYSFLFSRNDHYYLFARAFIPEERATMKEKLDQVPYRAWQFAGHISFTPGEKIDSRFIIDELVKDLAPFDVDAIVYDPYGVELIRQELEYVHGFRLIELKPTPSNLSPACGFFEREILGGNLHHDANPVMTWNVENVKMKTIGDKCYMEKRKQTQRIDTISASLLAISHHLDEQPNWLPRLF